MTDVLSRPDAAKGATGTTGPAAEAPAPAGSVARPPAGPAPDARGGTVPVILATLSAAAGAIHLALAPSHLAVSAVEGTGFLVAGWAQIGLAAALARPARPGRALLRAVVAVNAVLVGLWALSRTAGLPVGPHAAHPARVTIVDLAAVALEVGLVAGAAALLRRPRLAARRSALAAFAAPVAIIGLTTAVIASPAARDHAAHAHGDHGAGAAAAPVDDKGFSLLTNGHHHGAAGPDVKLDAATQAHLDRQLAVTRSLIGRFPNARAALAAGYTRYGAFTPGLGAHYVKPAGMVDTKGAITDAMLRTPVLIFDGSGPDAPLAGLMYVSINPQTVPEGFAGPNDHWHYHATVCLTARGQGGFDAPFGADQDVTKPMCDGIGGQWMPLTQYMVHAWVVPGYTNPYGVFAEANPHITCPDGTYYQIPWRDMGHRASTCRSA